MIAKSKMALAAILPAIIAGMAAAASVMAQQPSQNPPPFHGTNVAAWVSGQ